MDFIHEPTDLFDFQKVYLKTPTLIHGGNGGFFTKFAVAATEESAPFYIKTPTCTTKEGFVTSGTGGKKIHCDLMFLREDNEDFIRWMENLVAHTQRLIYSKHDEWFRGGISENDIEDAMISPIKSYKAGKYYLVRCGVKIENEQPQIRIYDESQREISMDDVTGSSGAGADGKKIMTLLEIKGVKCSLKSFQFEIEIKQAMAIKQFNILEANLLAATTVIPKEDVDLNDQKKEEPETPINKPLENIIQEGVAENGDDEKKNVLEELSHAPDEEDDSASADDTSFSDIIDGSIQQYLDNAVQAQAQAEEDAAAADDENSTENAFDDATAINLEEMDIDEEPVKIKDSNELYYQMYQEAKQKARDARRVAINAYLEAKNIKTLYDLEDAEESDFEDDDLDDLSDIENL